MSPSRSQILTHFPGPPRNVTDCLTFSNHRMLSFVSIETRVELIFLLSASQPLNFFLVQNFIAASPSGRPSTVVTKLECIKIPQTVTKLLRTSFFLSLPVGTLRVTPTKCGLSRL